MDHRTSQVYELMRSESNRLRSFQMNPPWPKDCIDIKKLAKAGFFYIFSGDKVHCAFCRGQVCRWERGDDPMTEHARHFTTCPFIMGGEVGNIPIGEDPLPGPKRPRAYDVCGPFPSFPLHDPRSIEENQNNPPGCPGHRAGDISDPTSYTSNNGTSTNTSLVNHENNRDQPETRHCNLTQLSTRHQMQETGEGGQSQEIFTSSACRDETSPSSIVEQKSEVSETSTVSSQIGICKICYTNTVNLVFLPCAHSVSCMSCAQRLSNCPFCREPITSRFRIYL